MEAKAQADIRIVTLRPAVFWSREYRFLPRYPFFSALPRDVYLGFQSSIRSVASETPITYGAEREVQCRQIWREMAMLERNCSWDRP